GAVEVGRERTSQVGGHDGAFGVHQSIKHQSWASGCTAVWLLARRTSHRTVGTSLRRYLARGTSHPTGDRTFTPGFGSRDVPPERRHAGQPPGGTRGEPPE